MITFNKDFIFINIKMGKRKEYNKSRAEARKKFTGTPIFDNETTMKMLARAPPAPSWKMVDEPTTYSAIHGGQAAQMKSIAHQAVAKRKELNEQRISNAKSKAKSIADQAVIKQKEKEQAKLSKRKVVADQAAAKKKSNDRKRKDEIEEIKNKGLPESIRSVKKDLKELDIFCVSHLVNDETYDKDIKDVNKRLREQKEVNDMLTKRINKIENAKAAKELQKMNGKQSDTKAMLLKRINKLENAQAAKDLKKMNAAKPASEEMRRAIATETYRMEEEKRAAARNKKMKGWFG